MENLRVLAVHQGTESTHRVPWCTAREWARAMARATAPTDRGGDSERGPLPVDQPHEFGLVLGQRRDRASHVEGLRGTLLRRRSERSRIRAVRRRLLASSRKWPLSVIRAMPTSQWRASSGSAAMCERLRHANSIVAPHAAAA